MRLSREGKRVGAITGVSRIKFVLKYIKKKKRRKTKGEEDKRGGRDPVWKRRKESRRNRRLCSQLLLAPATPRILLYPLPSPCAKFERRQRRARRIYFIKTIFQPSSRRRRNFLSLPWWKIIISSIRNNAFCLLEGEGSGKELRLPGE